MSDEPEPTNVKALSDSLNYAELLGKVESGLETYALARYLTQTVPILGTVNPDEIEARAGVKLDKDHDGAFWYVQGSAGSGSTHRANRAIFDKWQIIPRMLVDATVRDICTTIFGVRYPSPLILGPVGVQGIVHAEAELATARAASKLNLPFTLSTAATRSIEEVATESGDGPRWYQLYWPKDDNVTLSLLSRAKANKYSALVVTLDTMLLGWRPKDLERAYLPFLHGVGCSVGFSDPVFMAKIGQQPTHTHPSFPYDPKELNKVIKVESPYANTIRNRMAAAQHWMGEQINTGYFRTWEDVAFLRKNWEGPLVLKGIQSAEDAEAAIEAGADGIIVSNHGGRQVDGAISSLESLELVMKSSRVREAQAGGKFTILFDSGIRTGADILKATALGAQAVLIGRMYMYGLALEGEAGVDAVIKLLLSDLSTTMGLSGHKSLDQVRGLALEGKFMRKI